MKVTKFNTNNVKQLQFSSQHRNVRAYMDTNIQQQRGDELRNTPSFVSCGSTGPSLVKLSGDMCDRKISNSPGTSA